MVRSYMWSRNEMKPSHLAVNIEIRTCLADRCLCSQNINKYSNKPAKWLGFISRSHIMIYKRTISLISVCRLRSNAQKTESRICIYTFQFVKVQQHNHCNQPVFIWESHQIRNTNHTKLLLPTLRSVSNKHRINKRGIYFFTYYITSTGPSSTTSSSSCCGCDGYFLNNMK